jgi:CheY-like chemotaxis protein
MELELIIEPEVRPRTFKCTDPTRATIERIALIVEDEWLVRLELAEALEDAGWTVVETNSGEEALTMLEEGERFDLLITDIRLHGAMTGWDVADAFRAAYPAIGVVYASGNSPIEVRQVAGSVFMSKPVRTENLVSTCETMWQAGKSSNP